MLDSSTFRLKAMIHLGYSPIGEKMACQGDNCEILLLRLNKQCLDENKVRSWLNFITARALIDTSETKGQRTVRQEGGKAMEMIEVVTPTLDEYMVRVRLFGTRYLGDANEWYKLRTSDIDAEDDRDEFSFIRMALWDKLMNKEFFNSGPPGQAEQVNLFGQCDTQEPGESRVLLFWAVTVGGAYRYAELINRLFGSCEFLDPRPVRHSKVQIPLDNPNAFYWKETLSFRDSKGT